jgi:hypothetical protein
LVKAEAYTYRITIVIGGNKDVGASFVSDTESAMTIISESSKLSVVAADDVITIDGLNYNDQVTFNPKAAVEITGDGADKYYVKGMRISGSNSVVSESTFSVKKDNSYVIAYGVGEVIPYTVKYVDGSGNELAEMDTFFGALGDEIYASYKYIDGYIPNSFNIHKNSLEEGDEFTFVYSKAPAAGTIYNTSVVTSYSEVEGGRQTSYQLVPASIQPVITNVTGGNGAVQTNRASAAGGGNAGGGAAEAGDDTTTIDDTETPRGIDDVIDIDDEPVARAIGSETVYDSYKRTALVLAVIGVIMFIGSMGAMIKDRRERNNIDDN